MKSEQFQQIAQLIHDAIAGGRSVKSEAALLRQSFVDLHYCFDREDDFRL